jgi:putative membrane protein
VNRITTRTAVLLSTTGLALGAVVTALPANAAPAKPSKADAAFLKSNEQVNLAEISLGTIAAERSTGKYALKLASQTVGDHKKAEKANKAVAKATGIDLPSTPNQLQLATAKSLSGVDKVAHHYFAEQIKGHRLSIAQTKAEIANGTSAAVVKYAKYYLPVAEMHLKMSLTDLKRYNASV